MKGITSEFKNILLKTQKDIKLREERFKKYKNVHEMTEYQNLYKENFELKRGLNSTKTILKIIKKKKEEKSKVFYSINKGSLKAIGRKKVKKRKKLHPF